MLKRIATIAGVLQWAPAVGVPVYNGRMLSIYELLIVLLVPAIALSSLEYRRLVFLAVAVGISMMSYLNSLNRSTSALYLQYYLLVIIPHMLLFVQIFEKDETARAFLVSFVKTGVWLGPLALIQFLSPFQIALANNTNYYIVEELHRTSLFSPEPSILAALYVIAISFAIYNSYVRIDPNIPAGVPSFVSMITALATTLSTSMLIVLPPLMFFTFRLCGVSWKRLMRIAAFGFVVLSAFYFIGYQSRVSGGDSTSSSLLRLASVLGGLYVIAQHSLTGLGLGMNKNVEDIVKVIYFALAHTITKKGGIDSFQIGLMAEMGVIPGVISSIFLVVCYRTVKRTASADRSATPLIAMFAICVSFVSLLTSGYRGLAYCWLYLPAGYVVYLRNKRKVDVPVLDPAMPLVAGRG